MAMEMRDYLRDEILEEADLGYISLTERDRRLSAFDRALGEKLEVRGGTAVMTVQSGPVANGFGIADSNIVANRPVASGENSDILTYLAKPKGGSALPGVVVIHENKGLVPYVEDVARRLAGEGFVAVAPDLLSRRGGTGAFSESTEATSALGTISRDDLVEDLMATVSMLSAEGSVDPTRVGVIGFCFGGGMAWRLITKDSRIKAAVPFYGPNPPLEDVPNIRASVLAIYGGLDDRINAGIDDITTAMERNGKVFEKIVYPGAQHAFHNDANPDRYHAEAAAQAWEQALAWLNRWLVQ